MQIQIFYDLGGVSFTQNQSNLLHHIRRQPPGGIAFKEPFQPPMLKTTDHLLSVRRQVTPVNLQKFELHLTEVVWYQP